MITNSYIYGEDVEVPEIPGEIICLRIELLNEHLAELLNVHWSIRDRVRVDAVLKAIDFWSKINEAEQS